MSGSSPADHGTESDQRLLVLIIVKLIKDLLAEPIRAAVTDAVHDAADSLARRPLVYSADQAAQVLSVSRRTVEMWVADGVLPRMPHTGRLLIPRIAIEDWVNDTVHRANR